MLIDASGNSIKVVLLTSLSGIHKKKTHVRQNWKIQKPPECNPFTNRNAKFYEPWKCRCMTGSFPRIWKRRMCCCRRLLRRGSGLLYWFGPEILTYWKGETLLEDFSFLRTWGWRSSQRSNWAKSTVIRQTCDCPPLILHSLASYLNLPNSYCTI